MVAAALDQIARPPTKTRWLSARGMLHGGPSALDQQSSKVIVAAFGDTTQSRLTARRMLLRCQAQPGCELAAVLEIARVAQRGNHSKRGDGSHARYGHDALGCLILIGQMFEFDVVGGDALVDLAQMREQVIDSTPGQQR